MVRASHKLSRINKVYMLNLGLRKIKQETTAPQIISFHRTPQLEKHKHRTPQGLRSPQHHKLKFYSPHHRIKKTSTPQHRKSPCPPPFSYWKIKLFSLSVVQ